jgi:hypothetical protein
VPDTDLETTRDLISIGAPHPAEQGLTAHDREDATQRFGHRCLIWGLGLYAGSFFSTFTISVAAEVTPYDSPAGRLFGLLAFLALVSAGTILIAIGGVERLQRPQRALARKALTETRQVSQRLDALETAAGSIPGRLADIDLAVRMFSTHLPDALARENWKGFNAAVREGFAATGTGGLNDARGGRSRLGLVNPPRSVD